MKTYKISDRTVVSILDTGIAISHSKGLIELRPDEVASLYRLLFHDAQSQTRRMNIRL